MVKVAFTVGRFQPPTIGHKALIQAVKDAADGGPAYVFVSSTMSPKAKNPLTSKQKLPILNHMFPSGVTFVDTQDCKDKGEACGGALDAFYWLINTKGIKKEDIILVVGDDRKPVFGPDADIWKRKEEKDVYSPGGFKFLKSDKRDPDLEVKDAANMSGTKAREYVKLDRKSDFYIAVGYDGASNKAAADAVYDVIKGAAAKKKGGAGTRKRDLETAFGADVEFTYPKRRTRRVKQKGGKKIGEGTFAFVVNPPVPCIGDEGVPRDGFVSRVEEADEDDEGEGEDEVDEETAKLAKKVEEELKKQRKDQRATYALILAELKRIDAPQKYFYYPDTTCVPDFENLTEENIKDGITSDMHIELIRWAPGGTWKQARRNYKRAKENGTLTGEQDELMKRQRKHLRKAKQLLAANRIHHNDLHNENIVIAEDGMPRIIDWDLATFFDPDAPRCDCPACSGGRRTRRVKRNKASGKA